MPGPLFSDDPEDVLTGDELAAAIRLHDPAPHAARLSGALPPSVRTAAVLRPVAAAIAERVTRGGDGSIDLRLSPRELGTLRISFVGSDTGLNVVIQADRPETLELFRRNIDLLSQDLHALGYDDVTMSFEGDRSNDSDRPARTGTADGADDFDAVDPNADRPPPPAPGTPPGRLDLRL
ncbi:flagellar hook-length control protein FliK [Tropicimonas sp. IMCC6043]|uniref:flagellar hook-length control protein FliK n=1 Tax=Tropicimonas sp. IMCC6043 TaxID=2510645 RepID=UPI0013EC95E1|nr:flagellar hook-length control protein FliK [Tropicimonas sp. IMCC6043]